MVEKTNSTNFVKYHLFASSNLNKRDIKLNEHLLYQEKSVLFTNF